MSIPTPAVSPTSPGRAADPTRQGFSGRDVLTSVAVPSDRLGVDDSGVLMIDGCRASDLVEEYGSPLFVVSESTLRDNASRVQAAFGTRWPAPVNVMFAIKANSNLAVRWIMTDLGLGGDCFSEGEIHATLAGGADPRLVALNGSNKSPVAVETALQQGLLIQIDSEGDLDLLGAVMERTGLRARIGVRIRLTSEDYGRARVRHPELPDIGHYIDTEQVGSSYESALSILRRALADPRLEVEGFHFHLGRLSRHPEYVRWWAAGVGGTVGRLTSATGFRPNVLNIGGGWCREREPENTGGPLMNPVTIEEYAAIVTEELRSRLEPVLAELPRLWLEPGRYIAGNAGVLLSRVGTVKTDAGLTWLNVDASINDLPRVENLAWDYVALAADRMDDAATLRVEVVGSLCVGRHLKTEGTMPDLMRGDLVAFLDAGAYAETAANQYNAVPRPATVLVHGSTSWLIKERETVADLFVKQRVPPHLLRSSEPTNTWSE